MKYFIVAHDFRAEENVELSVDKGEVLCATEGVAQDGWVKVEVITDARRRGFVPMSYLSELSAAEAMALLERKSNGNSNAALGAASSSSLTHTTHQEERGDTSTAGAAHPRMVSSTSLDMGSRSPDGGLTAAAATAPTNSPRIINNKTAVAKSAEPHPLTPAQKSTGSVHRHLLENPNAAVDAFMKNEVYFKQLMQRRASALAQMQSGLEEAMTEVAACKDRNTVLTRKLRDLDEVVERERERWMNRVEEEKAHVSRTAPCRSGMAVLVSSGTTPVRSPIDRRQGGSGRSV